MSQYKVLTPVAWEISHNKKMFQQNHNICIGVLSLQGDFLEHIVTLQQVGVTTKEVRLPQDLDDINGIIFPGGESTAMANLLDVFALRKVLKMKIQAGLPVWGTCAGMVLLASKVIQDRPTPLGLMNITVNRNAFGRQIHSFQVPLQIKPLGEAPLYSTFIRAPWIENVGSNVEILSTLEDGTIVAVKQNNMLATAFHPELTGDDRFHEYFISLVKRYQASSTV